MERDGFIFYRSFWDGIKNLPDDIRNNIVTCIMEYGLDGKEPQNDNPIVISVFALIKPQIDANNKKYENGKKGGRPKNQTETKVKPNNNQEETSKEPNKNQNETKHKPKDKDKVKDKENVKDNDNKETSTNVDTKKEKTNFDKFNVWIKENTPNVMKLSNQMTEEQFNKARSKYDFEQMSHILLQMENYKGLTKKYTSVYLTFINWAKREYGNK